MLSDIKKASEASAKDFGIDVYSAESVEKFMMRCEALGVRPIDQYTNIIQKEAIKEIKTDSTGAYKQYEFIYKLLKDAGFACSKFDRIVHNGYGINTGIELNICTNIEKHDFGRLSYYDVTSGPNVRSGLTIGNGGQLDLGFYTAQVKTSFSIDDIDIVMNSKDLRGLEHNLFGLGIAQILLSKLVQCHAEFLAATDMESGAEQWSECGYNEYIAEYTTIRSMITYKERELLIRNILMCSIGKSSAYEAINNTIYDSRGDGEMRIYVDVKTEKTMYKAKVGLAGIKVGRRELSKLSVGSIIWKENIGKLLIDTLKDVDRRIVELDGVDAYRVGKNEQIKVYLY